MGVSFLFTERAPNWRLLANFFGLANVFTLFGQMLRTHYARGLPGEFLTSKVCDATVSYSWFWCFDIVLIHASIKKARSVAHSA